MELMSCSMESSVDPPRSKQLDERSAFSRSIHGIGFSRGRSGISWRAGRQLHDPRLDRVICNKNERISRPVRAESLAGRAASAIDAVGKRRASLRQVSQGNASGIAHRGGHAQHEPN